MEQTKTPWYKKLFAPGKSTQDDEETQEESAGLTEQEGQAVLSNEAPIGHPGVSAASLKDILFNEMSKDADSIRYHLFGNDLTFLFHDGSQDKYFIYTMKLTSNKRQVVLSNGAIDITSSFRIGPQHKTIVNNTDYGNIMLNGNMMSVQLCSYRGITVEMMKDDVFSKTYYALTHVFVKILLDVSEQLDSPEVRASVKELGIMKDLRQGVK